MTEFQEVASGLQFPEGPIAMPDGSVVLVEIKRGTLTRVGPDGVASVVAKTGGGPNGAAMGPDGSVYVCNNGGFEWHVARDLDIPGGQPDDYIGGRIQKVDLDSGEVQDLYTACGDVALRGPNDLVFDAHGGFYFTDHGKVRDRAVDQGVVYYARADGSEIREVAFPLTGPNGIGLSPVGDRLYVAETHTGRVWWWDIEEPGVLSRSSGPGAGRGNLLATLPGYQLLDSLAVDGDGNVCVATLLTGGITVISPAGEILEFVKVPGDDLFITNVCFGGPDLRTAFVTSSGRGRLYAGQWARPGLALQH